ncbi:hypothetical protein QQF64_026133 [Cirrhinus molitorella]|uniref:Uncharacterized protein n=1 Tax=Cirrhinus molitorella TaxID=172907 RepID=A0ABR3NSE2_9TELE
MEIIKICHTILPQESSKLTEVIDVVHRLGKKKPGVMKPRGIILRFLSRTHRDAIWAAAKNSPFLREKGLRKSNIDRKTKSGNRAKAIRPTKETKQKGYVKKGSVHHLDADAVSSGDETDSDLALYKLSQPAEKSSIVVKPKVEGLPLEMELDTGAAVS